MSKDNKNKLEDLLNPQSDVEIDPVAAQRIDQETSLNDWKIKTVIATSPGITKGEVKFINETSRNVEEIREKIDEKTGADLDKASQLPTEQREFDENKDGKLDASENEKYKVEAAKKEEETQKAIDGLKSIFAGIAGVTVAKESVNPALGGLVANVFGGKSKNNEQDGPGGLFS